MLFAAIFYRIIPKTWVAMAIVAYTKQYKLTTDDRIETLFDNLTSE